MDVYFQCSTLLSLVSIANNVLSFCTPSLDLSECQKVLTARLNAGLAFEVFYQSFSASYVSTVNFKDAILQNSKDVDSQDSFLTSVAKSRYSNAVNYLQAARANFTVTIILCAI